MAALPAGNFRRGRAVLFLPLGGRAKRERTTREGNVLSSRNSSFAGGHDFSAGRRISCRAGLFETICFHDSGRCAGFRPGEVFGSLAGGACARCRPAVGVFRSHWVHAPRGSMLRACCWGVPLGPILDKRGGTRLSRVSGARRCLSRADRAPALSRPDPCQPSARDASCGPPAQNAGETAMRERVAARPV